VELGGQACDGDYVAILASPNDSPLLLTLPHGDDDDLKTTTRTLLSFKRREDLLRLGFGKTWFKED
jgi:hypothetical protein